MASMRPPIDSYPPTTLPFGYCHGLRVIACEKRFFYSRIAPVPMQRYVSQDAGRLLRGTDCVYYQKRSHGMRSNMLVRRGHHLRADANVVLILLQCTPPTTGR